MGAVILPRNQHPISRKNIDIYALKVMYRMHRKGFLSYLVGGGVRDLLLGRKPKDFDISTDARPGQVKKMFRNCVLVGHRFRLAHIKFDDKTIEVSTFRRYCNPFDANGAVQIVKHDNLYGSPEEDAQRRDFTINGLFYNIRDFAVIDYVNGLTDLNQRLVRSIGDPEIRFQEDPVRMVRAVRVAARLDFKLHEDVYNAIQKYRKYVLECPASRNLEEFLTLLRHGCAEASLRMLHEVGLTDVMFPELDSFFHALREQQLDPDRYYWRFIHALDAYNQVAGNCSPALLISAIFMPLIRFHVDMPEIPGNLQQGEILERVENLLEPFLERLQFPKRQRDRLTQIITHQHRYWMLYHRRFKSGSIIRKSYFEEGLQLFKIATLALNKGQSICESWERRLADLKSQTR